MIGGESYEIYMQREEKALSIGVVCVGGRERGRGRGKEKERPSLYPEGVRFLESWAEEAETLSLILHMTGEMTGDIVSGGGGVEAVNNYPFR